MNVGRGLNGIVCDSFTMYTRCMILSKRNLGSFLTGIATPVLMMLLFVYVLGGAIDVGNMDYINYLLPGILLQCIGQCGSITAISVNNDHKQGIISRFRTMPIAKSSVLIGYELSAIVRIIITTIFVVFLAILIGFRPNAGLVQWIIAIGLLILYIAAISSVSILFGLIAKSAETASAFTVLISFLPYLSSGFAPTNTMPSGLKIFAENQPMTLIIESLRMLLLESRVDKNLLYAIIWILIILIVSSTSSLIIFNKKLK